MQEANYVADSLLAPEPLNDRNSSSTTATQGECTSPCQTTLPGHKLARKLDQRMHMFQSLKNAGDISQKLIEKAITWIQITGFTKDFGFETIVLSIALFYASLNNITVNKKNLQPTLCACMLLASKMTARGQLTMSQIVGLIENRQSVKNMLEQQRKVLQFLDFNLHFQFPLCQLISSELGQARHQDRAQFMAEVLLLRECSILSDVSKIEEIIESSENEQLDSSLRVGAQVRRIIRRHGCQHLISKYQSKFNVAAYIAEDDHIQHYI